MSKDWVGNQTSIYKNLGASNHCDDERAQHDYYATSYKATELLMDLETFSHDIWEPAAGEKHITKILERHGYAVRNSDIIDRTGDIEVLDFLSDLEPDQWDGDIVTNPPYKYARQFVEQSINVVKPGHKVAMFLKLTFLEGKTRRALFDKYPPKTIWVSSSRLACWKNGEMKRTDNGETIDGGAVCYCWFIWEKGFNGAPTVKWFN